MGLSDKVNAIYFLEVEQHFIYTKHAQTRMEQRNLTKSQIEETVLEPDRLLLGLERRKLAQKEFSGYTLEVVYKQEEGRIVVLTAYWLWEV